MQKARCRAIRPCPPQTMALENTVRGTASNAARVTRYDIAGMPTRGCYPCARFSPMMI